MASGAGSCWWTLVALLIVARAFPAAATSFTVGGKSGWTIGVDYTTWASGNTFKVGDSLVFNYAKGLHTVAEVSAADYLACAAANALGSDASGATTVPLKTGGKHYFICTITGHCAGGMKLEVTVSGSGSGPGSSSPTTPMPTPTTPYTSPTPTTPYTTPTTPYTTPTTPYTTPTSPACTGTTPGATPLTPVTPGTMPFYSYNGAAGLAPVAWASVALVCAAVAQLGLL